MLTQKTKTAYRLVVNGSIRFGARLFSGPALFPLSGTQIYIAYDSLKDTELDVIDFNQQIVATATVVDIKAVA